MSDKAQAAAAPPGSPGLVLAWRGRTLTVFGLALELGTQRLILALARPDFRTVFAAGVRSIGSLALETDTQALARVFPRHRRVFPGLGRGGRRFGRRVDISLARIERFAADAPGTGNVDGWTFCAAGWLRGMLRLPWFPLIRRWRVRPLSGSHLVEGLAGFPGIRVSSLVDHISRSDATLPLFSRSEYDRRPHRVQSPGDLGQVAAFHIPNFREV